MNTSSELLDMIRNLTRGFFLCQILTITALYLLGEVFLAVTENKMKTERRLLLAFPVGLAVFTVSGAFLLMVGIPFNSISATAAPVIILILIIISGRVRHDYKLVFKKADLIAILTVLLIAAFASSGILSLTVSNDSVYYYSSFPAMLVKAGAYSKSFDTYLTNVGQTSAVINCIPFLYGFDTSFGIQHFLNINFLLFFFDAIYTEIMESGKNIGSDKRKVLLAALLLTLFLAGSTPFVVMSKWVLSNVYFMEYSFILFWLLKAERENKSAFDLKLFFLFALLTMLRQEGSAIVLIIIIAASSFDYTNKKLTVNFVLPVFLMEAFYYIMLFFRLGVDPLYSFLDWKKAAAILGACVLLGIYSFFIRGRILGRITENVNFWLILASAAGNLAIMAVSHSRYLTNLYAFYQNIRQGNGWGYFGIFLAAAVLLMAFEILRRRCRNISYETGYLASMLLVTIAVAWARGGSLVIRASDSGNRILLQTVPFIVYILFEFYLRFMNETLLTAEKG